MSFHIFPRIAGDRVASLLPPDYRGRVAMVIQPSDVYTVVLFKHDRNNVVLSSAARRALRRAAGKGGRLLAVGGNFTLEARAALGEAGAELVALSDFAWTDESYTTIRQL